MNNIKLANDTPLVSMTGTVVDDEGRAAAGAEVSLMGQPGRIVLAPFQRADSNGRFIIAVVEGHRYSVFVNYHTRDARGRTKASFWAEVAVVGSSSSSPISVVLQRQPH